MQFESRDLGLIDHQESLAIQKEVVSMVMGGLCPDTLIFCEHYDVFTIGRKGGFSDILASKEELEKLNVKVVFTDRGGNVTYHGKGQLIAYPIFDLRKDVKDIHLFLRKLELTVINLLKHYYIPASIKSGKTGVWVNEEKIASIGIALSHWVTYHGLALNVNTGLNYFSLINPCGVKDVKMTSMAEILKRPIDIGEVKEELRRSFTDIFCGGKQFKQ